MFGWKNISAGAITESNESDQRARSKLGRWRISSCPEIMRFDELEPSHLDLSGKRLLVFSPNACDHHVPWHQPLDRVAYLRRIYRARFTHKLAYRRKVWDVLVPAFFQKYIDTDAAVLDLGCGYGEFINTVRCGKKIAMDLNPDAPKYLDSAVQFLEQDCSARWQLEDSSLHVVFTSNFFEHLSDKGALEKTLDEIFRCLVPGGKIIAIGPNIKYLPGKYWDFWDHHLPLTEKSLSEGLTSRGFQITECIAKFLPYTMVDQREYPAAFLKLYLSFTLAWKILGKQFLVVASKPR